VERAAPVRRLQIGSVHVTCTKNVEQIYLYSELWKDGNFVTWSETYFFDQSLTSAHAQPGEAAG
jgi:hypothetical protein